MALSYALAPARTWCSSVLPRLAASKKRLGKATGSPVPKRQRVKTVGATPPSTHEPTIPTVTFLHGKTGEISKTGSVLSERLETVLSDLILIKGLSQPRSGLPRYKGLYNPSPSKTNSRQWIYFTVTGLEQCPDDENPCFGWVAKGLGEGVRTPKTPGTYRKKYIGVTKGKPAWNRLAGEWWGKPDSTDAEVIGQWYTLLEEFKAHFMSSFSVTFIGIDGERLAGGSSEVIPEADLTEAINGALHEDSENEIAYDDPEGYHWTDYVPGDPRKYAQRYMGIVKPIPLNLALFGKDIFTLIGKYPYGVDGAAGGDPQSVPLSNPGPKEREWLTIMKEFEVLYSIHHQPSIHQQHSDSDSDSDLDSPVHGG
ncbi:hypothetical protein BDP27DRAFT_1360275 [Rhodocollybia butyracea]|uniref:Uncharacterized protein n=1 Tax=Rhodocollybia butyracea TaxID=206335 RepID=A0A9P5UAR6_9AGAR|nr:hypothetical protein BDP27DRAFT_1360275 [Rhodocollybia butyracea]